MRTDRVILAALLIMVAAARCGGTAAAQSDEVLVARLVVHEAGWDSLADCDAITAALLNGAARTSMTPAAFARVYAPRFARGHTSRRWTLRLNARGSDPRAGIRWSLFRDRWLAILERCRAALAAPPVCEATDWSSPSHMRRRIASGRAFRVVDCGETVNSYAVRGER